MNETKWLNYIGAKIIRATPMNEIAFLQDVKNLAVSIGKEDREGYLVTYPSMGSDEPYQSWSPKIVFENAYREVTEGETRLIAG